MANAPGQPPVVAESLQTHTPLDPSAEALARAWGHSEELRRRCRASPRLRRSARRITLLHMRVTQRAALKVMPVRSSVTY